MEMSATGHKGPGPADTWSKCCGTTVEPGDKWENINIRPAYREKHVDLTLKNNEGGI